MEKPIFNGWFGGKPTIFGNIQNKTWLERKFLFLPPEFLGSSPWGVWWAPIFPTKWYTAATPLKDPKRTRSCLIDHHDPKESEKKQPVNWMFLSCWKQRWARCYTITLPSAHTLNGCPVTEPADFSWFCREGNPHGCCPSPSGRTLIGSFSKWQEWRGRHLMVTATPPELVSPLSWEVLHLEWSILVMPD